MDILGRFSDDHANFVNSVTEELFENSQIRNISDVYYHAFLNKISILIYPRLTKYLTKTQYIPFRYKGLNVVLINSRANGPLNNFIDSLTKY